MNLEKQHSKRVVTIEKLINSMTYPGMHPILVLGDSGTGKTHWINKIVEKIDNPYFKSGKIFKYAGLCEEGYSFWNKVFKEANNKVLVIEEVEKLSIKCQDILFDALSTTDGSYGFENKEFRFILVFTSTFPIKKIRDDRRYLSAKFFDRISQFVVEFPNFDITQTKIFEDFKLTWEKMFKEDEVYKNKCPYLEGLKIWLKSEAYRIHGNFRDLDKIVVNWNQYQRNGKEDEEILPIIKEEFKHLLHNPHLKISDDNTYVFDEDSKYDQIMNDFRAKLKKWALSINENSIRDAAKMINISHRTMERW